MKKANNKQKKNKPTYIDDGRRIADMSSLRGTSSGLGGPRRRASLKEQFQTYISAVKLMFIPMLVTLGIISLAFILIYIIF